MKKIFLSGVLTLLSLSAYAQNYHFELTGSDGKTYTEKSFPGKHLLLAFGYTHCPDVCPTTLLEIKQTLAKLKNPDAIQALFVSIDPSRDDGAQLAKYTNYFSPKILGLYGSRQAIDAAVQSFHASYGYKIKGQKVDPDKLPKGSNYTVYHSTLIYLLDDQGKLLDAFDYQTGADALAQDIEKDLRS